VEAERGMFRDGLWKFYRSITYSYDEDGQMAEDPQYLEEEVMSLAELPEDFVKQRQTTDVMSLEQLDDYIWRLGKSGATTVVRNLSVDRYHRIISPFTSLFIILIGIPFALKIKKRATGLSSFGIALVVGFLYYVANAVGIALGKSGTIPWPLVSASLAHLLVLFFSLWMIFSLP
jgi:lipopolysaccharide export LptBFGC system permease protein LptF